MKFIVSSTVLSKSLQAISGVLSSSNTLPILDDFLFQLVDKDLVITASDLETTMTVTIPTIKAEEAGIIAIPAKILIDTLKTFADIPIIFTVNDENFSVELSAGEGKYKMAGHNSEEFPKLPVMESLSSLTIDSSVLGRAVAKTVFATGSDELRPVMSGVYCQFSPEDLTFVATDAHKLVRYKRTDASTTEVSSFIIPKKPLNQLKTLLAGQEFSVAIEYNQTNASFSFENINLICRLIEGRYPNYEAVIPTDNPNVMTVDRLSFLNSIKRVALFANQSTHQIRLKISGKELVISSEDVDFSNEARERLNCNYDGNDMEIGFNSRFLLDMLNNIDSEEIKLEMSAPNRAGILLPIDNPSEHEDLLMLVMPVMLNQ
jgi:DNA polymerase-3 subunit beta